MYNVLKIAIEKKALKIFSLYRVHLRIGSVNMPQVWLLIFLFNQNKFVFKKMHFHYITFFDDIKICFYSIKMNLYSVKYYFYSIKINLFISRKYFLLCAFFPFKQNIFCYMNFSFNTVLESISGLPLVFKWFQKS